MALALWPDLAATATPTRLAGWFHTIWFDGYPGSATSGRKHVLIDDQGQETELHVEDAAAQSRATRMLNGRRVTVDGDVIGLRRMRVKSIRLEGVTAADAPSSARDVTGAKPWVTILCRFSDKASTPQPKTWFEGQLGSAYPGLDHYWREVSSEKINLSGSAVVGWYTLPQPRSYYVYDRNGDGDANDFEDIDTQRLVDDCTAAADADVFFPAFTGVHLMFNDTLGCCAVGGTTTLMHDGQPALYYVTWMPAFQGPDPNVGGWREQGILAHEMGHGLGLPHSSGPYASPYDSRWDVMSDAIGVFFGDNCPRDPVYGCLATGTIAFHKDQLGWIPSARKFVPPPGSVTTITLERLNQPSGAGHLMVQIPINGSATEFYTVEARRFVGYDAYIPGEAVVIHHVDTTRVDRLAQVVDTDNNGNPNDAGARWLPGETFVDQSQGISVEVMSATASGFQVKVTFMPAAAGAPSVAITAPTTGSTFSTHTTPLDLAGTAQDDVAVTQVTWGNDRGGSGTASGTTTWAIAGVPLRPGTNVITVTAHDADAKTGDDSLTVTFTNFVDVPTTHPFFAWIEALFAAGITGGCNVSPAQYCPDAEVTRAQMAVFLLRGIHGAAYGPPPPSGIFADVPTDHPFAAWIERLFVEGVTAGCATNPLRYCPAQSVTRGQMAVFLLRAKHGAGYQPPDVTGMFADVPADHPFAPWIEQLAREGITGGCAMNPARYCPDALVTRGQMAVFLVRTFNVPL